MKYYMYPSTAPLRGVVLQKFGVHVNHLAAKCMYMLVACLRVKIGLAFQQYLAE